MKSIINYTLITARRDWLFLGVLILIMLATSLAIFLGGTAIAEEAQMSTAYIASSSRIITVIGMVLFICFHVRRAFDNKEVELILSKPINRTRFVIAYFAGFALLIIAIIGPIILLFLGMNSLGILQINLFGLGIWGISFLLEVMVIAAMAFFASIILSSAVVSVLFCFAFYFISRIFGYFLISINNPHSLTKGHKIGLVSEKILELLGILLPRLDMMAKTEWLIYGVSDAASLGVFFIAIAVYIPFILTMALFDFLRKQF